MAKKQKEAVVELVKATLPHFIPHHDIAVDMLSKSDLEFIKDNVFKQILSGSIVYSKDISNISEVKSYARSMVAHHLRKAKELNCCNTGATNKTETTTVLKRFKHKTTKPLVPKGVNGDILPDELRELAASLV